MKTTFNFKNLTNTCFLSVFIIGAVVFGLGSGIDVATAQPDNDRSSNSAGPDIELPDEASQSTETKTNTASAGSSDDSGEFGTPSQPDDLGTPSQPDDLGTPSQPDDLGTPSQPDDLGTPNQPDAARSNHQGDRSDLAATSIGGYAEIHYGRKLGDTTEPASELDFHRFVVFLGRRISPKLRFYSEIEVEHAKVSASAPGEVAIEQAFIDYQLAGDSLTLRTGIVLVPMGLINEHHEPPTFHGVERPNIEKVIIPSTWREGGIGVLGHVGDSLHYQAYVIGGLNPAGFSDNKGLRGGRQNVAAAKADGLAVTGRVDYEPVLGVTVGASAYAGLAGPNLSDTTDSMGNPADLSVPVIGAAVNVRARRAGFEAKILTVGFAIGDTAKLAMLDIGGNPGPAVPSSLYGFYGELAYDVLSLGDRRSNHQLLPFARYEHYKIAERTQEFVLGVTFKPAAQVAFKTDLTIQTTESTDATATFHLGAGVMF